MYVFDKRKKLTKKRKLFDFFFKPQLSNTTAILYCVIGYSFAITEILNKVSLFALNCVLLGFYMYFEQKMRQDVYKKRLRW